MYPKIYEHEFGSSSSQTCYLSWGPGVCELRIDLLSSMIWPQESVDRVLAYTWRSWKVGLIAVDATRPGYFSDDQVVGSFLSSPHRIRVGACEIVLGHSAGTSGVSVRAASLLAGFVGTYNVLLLL